MMDKLWHIAYSFVNSNGKGFGSITLQYRKKARTREGLTAIKEYIEGTINENENVKDSNVVIVNIIELEEE